MIKMENIVKRFGDNKGKTVEQGVPTGLCKRHDAIKTVPGLEAVFIKRARFHGLRILPHGRAVKTNPYRKKRFKRLNVIAG